MPVLVLLLIENLFPEKGWSGGFFQPNETKGYPSFKQIGPMGTTLQAPEQHVSGLLQNEIRLCTHKAEIAKGMIYNGSSAGAYAWLMLARKVAFPQPGLGNFRFLLVNIQHQKMLVGKHPNMKKEVDFLKGQMFL